MFDDGDDLTARHVAIEFVNEAPRGVGVKKVEVGKRRARVFDDAVPPRRRPRHAIARGDLVGFSPYS